MAAMGGSYHVVEFLAGIPGIEMDPVDGKGRTPLWFAERYDKGDIVTFLKARGQQKVFLLKFRNVPRYRALSCFHAKGSSERMKLNFGNQKGAAPGQCSFGW